MANRPRAVEKSAALDSEWEDGAVMSSLNILAVGFLLLACSGDPAPSRNSGQSGELALAASFDPDPSVTGRNTMEIELSDRAGMAVSGASFAVELWMPAHGHGSSSVPQVVELDAGRYRSEDLIFTMPGEWEVRVAVSAEEQRGSFVIEREVR